MSWNTSIPPAPAPPSVTGWWAIFNLLARQTVSVVSAAAVVGVMVAAQSFTATSTASTVGVSHATQSAALTDSATVAAAYAAPDPFTITDAATVKGVATAPEPLPVIDAASVVGIMLAPQQVSMLNSLVVNETIASVTGNEFVPVVDAATVVGMMAAGETFTATNAAAVYGKPGAAQTLAVTEGGTVIGIDAANVQLLISNIGTVYARIVGTQSFTVTNAASTAGARTGTSSFSITNSATCVLITSSTTFVGSNVSSSSSITIPAHVAGDAILIFAAGTGTIIPTKPTAGGTVPNWAIIDSQSNPNGQTSFLTVGYIATASNTTSGAFSGAGACLVAVIRGAYAAGAIGGSSKAAGTTATSGTSAAFTLVNSDGTSQILHFWVGGGATSWPSTPAGYTKQQGQSYGLGYPGVALVTKDVTTSDGAVSQTFGISGVWQCHSLEVKAY